MLLLAGPVVMAGSAQAQTPQIPPPAPYQAVDRNGVNLATGSFLYTTPEISVGPKGQGGLSYTATYDTGVNDWRHSVAGMVSYAPFLGPGPLVPWYTVTIQGASAVYRRTSAGEFRLIDGAGTLAGTTNNYTYTAQDGSIAVFNAGVTYSPYVANGGLISTLTRPNGEVLTYTYTAIAMPNGQQARRLQSVTNTYGYQLHFEYGANVWSTDWYRLTKVVALNNAVDACAPTANNCTFSQTWPSLTFTRTPTERTVTDSLGRVTRLLFPGGWLSGIRLPTLATGQNITLTRDLTGEKTASVSDGAGTWAYDYGAPPSVLPPFYTTTTAINGPGLSDSSVEITWTQPDISSSQRINRITSAANGEGETTDYAYDSAFHLAWIDHPEGDRDRWYYNAWGDVARLERIAKPGSGLAAIDLHAAYSSSCPVDPALCGRPISTTDARGGVTNYTYDAAGNLLTQTGPAPTPGAPRPQTRYVWAQRYAWYKRNGAAAITQAASPVWVQVSQSQCLTGATCE